MTKERLEESIKQGGIVGNIDEHIAIKLDPKIHEIFYPYDGSSELLYEKDLTLGKSVYKCEVYDLEEISKKDFDEITWHNKTHAERTERFEPPMWEEIESNYVFGFTLNKEGEVFSVEIKVLIGKEKDTGLIRVTDKFGILYVDHATKENYEKACEMVRDLFKGEK